MMRWTEYEERHVANLRIGGAEYSEIAMRLGRTVRSVENKLTQRLGILLEPRWTAGEMEVLRAGGKPARRTDRAAKVKKSREKKGKK